MKHLLFWLLCSIATFQVQAQTMHLVVVVNTNEPGREVDRTEDFNQMKRFWQETATRTGVAFSMKHLGGNQFTSTDVLNACRNLAVGSKDIVIFYYSGHGANDKTSKWPVLDLKDRLFKTTEVIRVIREKNPKFMMVMADCCNSYFNGMSVPVEANPHDESLYRDLFLNFQGQRQVLISASSPGEYSWSHLNYGSFWGMAFREAFRRATDNSKSTANWDSILNDAKRLAKTATKDKQTAQCEVITQGDISED